MKEISRRDEIKAFVSRFDSKIRHWITALRALVFMRRRVRRFHNNILRNRYINMAIKNRPKPNRLIILQGALFALRIPTLMCKRELLIAIDLEYLMQHYRLCCRLDIIKLNFLLCKVQ